MLVRLAVLGGEVARSYPDRSGVITLLNEIAQVRAKLGMSVRHPFPGGSTWDGLEKEVSMVMNEVP